MADEHLSPKVEEICGVKRAISLHHWKNGSFVGESDECVLQAAATEELVLVTFDVNTIPRLLQNLAIEGLFHAGVVFISSRSIAQNDSAGIEAALVRLAKRKLGESWRNRSVFLTKQG